MFKLIHHFFRHRWEKHYSKSHWHLVLDLSLTIVVIFLLAIVIGLYFFRSSFPNIGVYKPPAVNLNHPPLILNFSVNKTSIYSTKEVPLKIDFKNNGSLPINKLTINLTLSNKNFILNGVDLATSTSPVVVKGTEIILSKIKAYQSGEVSLKVNFKTKNTIFRIINWQAQNEYQVNKQLFKELKILPVLKVIAPLNAQDYVYYTSPQGDQLGIGPLPPIVGIPTVYWVFWEVKSPNNFRNIIFNARLPKGVELATGRSLLTGKFNYSSSTRQLIWKIPEIKGGDNSYRLGFAVKVTPNIKQLGEVITLLNSPQYYAVDSLTGQVVSGRLKELTTNLETDRFNAGQGKVVAQ